MKKKRVAGALFVCLIAGYFLVQAGDLEPPGPPAPTMRTLPEVEPCTPIESLPPFGGFALHRISTAGSYCLSQNLIVPEDMFGVSIGADDVAIDLRGFAIIGTGGTAGSGISGPSSGHRNLAVRNGTVRDFPGLGLFLQLSNVLAENLHLVNNGEEGISVGAGSIVRNVVARDNGDDGIVFAGPSLITECVAIGNLTGFMIGAGNTPGSVILNNIAHDNSFGFRAILGGNNRIEGNQATENTTGFVVTATGNVIVRNNATGNTTNYSIGAGNDAGPIGTAASATSPWANISN